MPLQIALTPRPDSVAMPKAFQEVLQVLPKPDQVAQMVGVLCSWFDEYRRDLPWRRNLDPYSIWISEAMLQQTRVETVIEYHRRFLERLPDVQSLARAKQAEVLALWSGLGYYRRARALHAAAQVIMEQHGGRIPQQRDAFLALPGVGPYTAGAVLSIAFQQAEALVDGNVGRVFSRLFGLHAELGSGAAQRQLWQLARHLMPGATPLRNGQHAPRLSPGNWNQALMELGALVCTPRAPACASCPLAATCVAHREGLTDALPVKRKKAPPLEVHIEILLLQRGRSSLLRQRPPGGPMAGLWELPTREVRAPKAKLHGIWSAEFGLPTWGVEMDFGPDLGQLSHSITKHRIRARVLAGKLPKRAPLPRGGELRWVSSVQCADLGITGLTRKCLERLG